MEPLTVRLPDAGERFVALTVRDCAALSLGVVEVKPVRVEVDGEMAGEVAAWRVFAPPAVVEPDFEPEAKVRSFVVRALTLSVTPPAGEAAMSEVMKM